MPPIPSGGRRLRPFVVADYTHGRLQCEILDCPYAGCDEACAVVQHDRRVRKTGPTHALVVLRCLVHACSFTVYPPGFVPYSRRQLVEGPAQHDVPALLEVVDRAADHGPQGRDANGSPDGSWSTLNRILDRVGRSFGLEALERRILAGTAFQIPLTELEAAASVRGCRARGGALRRLLGALRLDDLLALGALMGCWGRPHRWLDARDQLVALPLSRGPPMKSDR